MEFYHLTIDGAPLCHHPVRRELGTWICGHTIPVAASDMARRCRHFGPTSEVEVVRGFCPGHSRGSNRPLAGIKL